MDNKVGNIPEFTSDETPGSETGKKEVKQDVVDETTVKEKEKETPTEPPADTKPASEPSDDSGELLKQLKGLEGEKEKLLKEIQELRGNRREIKEQKLEKIENQIDELKDINPDDIKVMDRVLRAKGYLTKDEANKLVYDQTKNQELTKFLDKYPEYKPENDKNDLNWHALERELGYYRMPSDPHGIGEILLRAHKAIQNPSTDRTITDKKQKIDIAGVGAGGIQRSSSKKTLSSEQRDAYLRGGWSEEEIKTIEGKL